MIVVSTSFLNACFTRLICPSEDIHEETVLIICSLKVSHQCPIIGQFFFMFKDAIEKVQPPENTLILATNEPGDLYFFVEL